ncbi:hypothetical protein H0H81_009560, partial [Sphagnurus paluster]
MSVSPVYALLVSKIDIFYSRIQTKLRSGELSALGDEWPSFLFHGYIYDPEDPWNGLFRSSLLVKAFKHIFTSPSSVDKEPKATRSGNARIHGMTHVTLPSIASDMATDSERFYNSILDLFEDTEEQEEVNDLLRWWD